MGGGGAQSPIRRFNSTHTHTLTRTPKDGTGMVLGEGGITGNSLVVQSLGLGAFTAKGPGSTPGQGTKIPKAAWLSQKKVISWYKK